MIQRTLIAKRYASAILSFATEQEVEKVIEELRGLSALYFEPTLRAALLNPCLSLKIQGEIFAKIASKLKVTPLAEKFVKTLIDEGRIGLIKQVAESLRDLSDRKQDVVRGFLKAPVKPSAEVVKEVETTLNKLLQLKVLLTPEEDSELLAGMRIEMKGMTIDTSLKSRLAALAQSI